MLKTILFISILITLTISADLQDPVDCFRQKDSSYGHFLTCSSAKPLPMKVQTTFQLDKDYTWGIFSYDVALFSGLNKTTTSLSKCLQGSPGVGNKTAGTNLTLATTCNALPRELQQYDMVRYEVHFPNTEWLVWSVPIPGYSTQEDVQRIMNQAENKIPIIAENEKQLSESHSPQVLKFIEHIKLLKHIRKA